MTALVLKTGRLRNKFCQFESGTLFQKGFIMSRSYKKHAFTGFTCATSEKWDKRKANRRLRYRQEQALRNEDILPVKKEISNIWGFAKDGKHLYKEDSDWYKKSIRK